MTTFLEPAEISRLTGYKQKGKQAARLKQMGIPFWINAAGQPVVAQATIEGRKVEKRKAEWSPSWAESRP